MRALQVTIASQANTYRKSHFNHQMKKGLSFRSSNHEIHDAREELSRIDFLIDFLQPGAAFFGGNDISIARPVCRFYQRLNERHVLIMGHRYAIFESYVLPRCIQCVPPELATDPIVTILEVRTPVENFSC